MVQNYTEGTWEEQMRPSGKKSKAKASGERYLPRKAREALSDKEYAATSRAKREGTKQGKQFVKQPKKIAEKTAKYRK